MLIRFLFFRAGRVPEVVGVEAAIDRLLTTLSSQNVNSPFRVHVASKFRVSDDHLTQDLSAVAVLPLEFLATVFSFFHQITNEVMSVVDIVIVVDNVLVWAVKFVSFLPVRVCHPEFFLGEMVAGGLVMGSYLQKVSMAEGEVCRGQHSFDWPSHRLWVLF